MVVSFGATAFHCFLWPSTGFFICVGSCRWGNLSFRCTEVGHHKYVPVQSDQPIEFRTARNHSVLVAPIEGKPSDDCGWVFEQLAPFDTVLRHNLKCRHTFTKWELLQANTAFALEQGEHDLHRMTEKQFLQRINRKPLPRTRVCRV